MAAKAMDREQLRDRLIRLRTVWPELRRRLKEHLIPAEEIRRMLGEAGAPTEPEQIGISRQHLHISYYLAYFIRRRFTILDLVMQVGAQECIESLFDPRMDTNEHEEKKGF
jgi:glycerol-1-phosphate dehydrogenase [NAD(P)+]